MSDLRLDYGLRVLERAAGQPVGGQGSYSRPPSLGQLPGTSYVLEPGAGQPDSGQGSDSRPPSPRLPPGTRDGDHDIDEAISPLQLSQDGSLALRGQQDGSLALDRAVPPTPWPEKDPAPGPHVRSDWRPGAWNWVGYSGEPQSQALAAQPADLQSQPLTAQAGPQPSGLQRSTGLRPPDMLAPTHGAPIYRKTASNLPVQSLMSSPLLLRGLPLPLMPQIFPSRMWAETFWALMTCPLYWSFCPLTMLMRDISIPISFSAEMLVQGSAQKQRETNLAKMVNLLGIGVLLAFMMSGVAFAMMCEYTWHFHFTMMFVNFPLAWPGLSAAVGKDFVQAATSSSLRLQWDRVGGGNDAAGYSLYIRDLPLLSEVTLPPVDVGNASEEIAIFGDLQTRSQYKVEIRKKSLGGGSFSQLLYEGTYTTGVSETRLSVNVSSVYPGPVPPPYTVSVQRAASATGRLYKVIIAYKPGTEKGGGSTPH
ncbi:Hypp3956 [Branchiostoma lanceolatum]|uniref:Hypp3956 protein n=1 Tax=Branchiostoma lanceolatum TaxID=7740 RepID=A0A8K0A6I5_BRALA|nr:Hypp3956 [Branchiostoma lanceolatum]